MSRVLPPSVRRYHRLRAAGKCTRCQGAPAETGRSQCPPCLAKDRERLRKHRQQADNDRAVGEFLRADTPWLYAAILESNAESG